MDATKSPFDGPEFPDKSESSTGDASSATAMFGTVSADPMPRQDEDPLKSLIGSQPPATPDAGPQGLAPSASANPPAPVSSPAAAAKAPNDLASVFTQVVVEKTTFVPPPPSPPAARKPGEFTQLLQTMNASAPKPESQTPAPPSSAGPASDTPGAFTQMFNPVSAAQAAVFPISPPPAPDPAGPGEFTRMFQSAPSQSSTPAAAPPAPVGPGAFTQMFYARPIDDMPADDPLNSLKPEPPPPASTFQFPSSAARPNEAVPAAQGGFTQLLHALNKEESPKPAGPQMAPPPLQPAPPAPAAGGFTQLLQTLSAESTPKTSPAPAMPPVQPGPAPAPSSGGPGEFTRIISGSQLRDLQAQNAAPGPPVAAPPQASRPMQFPQAPAFLSAPPMPQIPAAHAAAPPSATPHFQPPAFQFPPAPAPQAPPPPATSKLQQHLPLILILNIFILLVIVLILIFVLRHH